MDERNRFGTWQIWIAATGALVSGAFLLWAFSRPGTLGLYRWGYKAPFLALMGLAAFALIVTGAYRIIASKTGRRIVFLGWFGAIAAILSLGVGGGVATFILLKAYGGDLPTAADKSILPDPRLGLAVPAGRSLRVALSSDPHFDRDISNHEATTAILARAQAEVQAGSLDAFFMLGDFVEMGFLASGWNAALGELKRLAPDVPFYALMGNHDAMVGGDRRWRAAFQPSGPEAKSINDQQSSQAASDQPVFQSAAFAQPSPYMWRLDAGRVHFIAINLPWGPEDFSRRERTWLAAQLDSIPQDDFTVVLSHSFFHSSGYVDEDTGMPWYEHAENLVSVAPLLASRVDLVVSGHNHYMEWIEADGTAWAVVGAMGGKPDPEPSYRSTGSVFFSRGKFGRLVLQLVTAGLSCSFEDISGQTLFSRIIPWS